MFALFKSLFRRKHNIIRIPSELAINDLAYLDKFAAMTAACRDSVVHIDECSCSEERGRDVTSCE